MLIEDICRRLVENGTPKSSTVVEYENIKLTLQTVGLVALTLDGQRQTYDVSHAFYYELEDKMRVEYREKVQDKDPLLQQIGKGLGIL